jgi:hypothetical protein
MAQSADFNAAKMNHEEFVDSTGLTWSFTTDYTSVG